jgi:chorismate dehydratase
MRRLRISAISFLNTAPLMWDFEHGDADSAFDVSYTLPSQCASALKEGSADIGIIPAAAYAEISNLAILPGVAIASKQAVRSILLVSKGPINEVKSVALDTSSMTSVALTKVLFSKRWKRTPQFSPMPPDLNQMLAKHDAALVIGDPALKVDRTRFTAVDLAEEWIEMTGKSFVFAFWAVRRQALAECNPNLDLAAIFQASRDHGLEAKNVEQIGREWATRLGLSELDVRGYLTENIHYFLDNDSLDGLRLFYRYAAEVGALPSAPDLNFLQAARAVAS